VYDVSINYHKRYDGSAIRVTMLVLAVIAQCVWLAGSILWAVSRANRIKDPKRSVIRGSLLLYGLLVAGHFLFSIVVPRVLVAAKEDSPVVVASFPEPICNVPVILFGWGFALIVMVSARAIRRSANRRL
jgi:amino acid transporter